MRRAPHRELERLYRRHHREISRVLARETGDLHEAEDLTQEAFLNAFRALERGNTPVHPRPWLYAIAVNAHRRSHRRRRPAEVPLESLPERAAPEAQVETRELVAALAELPPEQRAALLLREVAGLSYRELAQRLGRSEGSVQMLLFRGRSSVRAILGARVAVLVSAWQRLAEWLGGAGAPLGGGVAKSAAALAVAAAALSTAGSDVGPATSGGADRSRVPARAGSGAGAQVPPAFGRLDRPGAAASRATVRRVKRRAESAVRARTRSPVVGADSELETVRDRVESAVPAPTAAVEGAVAGAKGATSSLPLPTSPPAVEVPPVPVPDAPKLPAPPQPPAAPQLPEPPQLPTPQLPALPTVTVPTLPG